MEEISEKMLLPQQFLLFLENLSFGEMDQCPRAHTVLIEDLNSSLSAHLRQL